MFSPDDMPRPRLVSALDLFPCALKNLQPLCGLPGKMKDGNMKKRRFGDAYSSAVT